MQDKMYLLVVATSILSSSAIEYHSEGDRSLITKYEDRNFLSDDAYEVAAIALGYPVTSSSDWDYGSTASRAIMTKINVKGNGPAANYYAHWCSGFADQNQWLQVSFLQPRIVTAVSLIGWVTSFKIKYSIDGKKWQSYNNDTLLKGSMVEGKD
jgi:hypothetical protein